MEEPKPRRILPLTDMQILKSKPREKKSTLFDGGELFLLVTPSGGKLWRLKYRYEDRSEYYQALKVARKMIDYEQEAIKNAFKRTGHI